MAAKRKNYGAEFEAKVALEAIRGELMAKHYVHQILINTWKRQELEDMSGISSGKAEAKSAEKEGEIEKLHTKIGQLVVEQYLFDQSLWTVTMAWRQEMIETEHTVLSIARQCALIGIRRSAWYGRDRTESSMNLAQFTEKPFYGSRQMARHLCNWVYCVGYERIRRLMARLGLRVVNQGVGVTVQNLLAAGLLLRKLSRDTLGRLGQPGGAWVDRSADPRPAFLSPLAISSAATQCSSSRLRSGSCLAAGTGVPRQRFSRPGFAPPARGCDASG